LIGGFPDFRLFAWIGCDPRHRSFGLSPGELDDDVTEGAEVSWRASISRFDYISPQELLKIVHVLFSGSYG